MLTYDATFELSRQRLETSQARASLMGSLGNLPRPRAMFTFRRAVRPLLETVEIRHANCEQTRLKQRLMELSANRQKAS